MGPRQWWWQSCLQKWESAVVRSWLCFLWHPGSHIHISHLPPFSSLIPTPTQALTKPKSRAIPWTSSSVLNQLPSDPLFPLTLWNTIAKKSVHINWRITFLQFSNYYLGSAYFLSIAYPRMWGYRTCPIHRKGDRISTPETKRV